MPKPSRRVIDKPEALRFHEIYGKGIGMSPDFRQATRTAGFGDSIVFSSRTIRTYERIYLRHRQKDVDWIGSLRVGFCVSNPREKFTRETLPSLAFKNLRDQDGYFLRACPDELLRTSPIIYVYYSFDGQIYIGGYDRSEPAQAVLTINEHSGPYFLFCEIYGKTDQIEIVDESTLPNQSAASNNALLSPYQDVLHIVTTKLSKNGTLRNLQYFHYLFSANAPHNLTFLPTNRHNVVTTPDRRIVCVENRKLKSSYAFVNSPMKVGDVLVCRVMDCDTNSSATFLFGLTTANPNALQNQTLPDETETLISGNSAAAQWFVDSDISCQVSLYDECAFWFDDNGRVSLSINNRPAIQLRIDNRSSNFNQLTLYPFFDLYGQVTSLCLYNISNQNKLNLNEQIAGRELCPICCDHLVDTELFPCLCRLCRSCAETIKKPTLISDCPFDRRHITQLRPLS